MSRLVKDTAHGCLARYEHSEGRLSHVCVGSIRRPSALSGANRGTWGSVMISEDLRRKNARLHDMIEWVLEMHPELREGAEALALNQDLHVEVGAPFLERTRDKLRERARAIVERCP